MKIISRQNSALLLLAGLLVAGCDGKGTKPNTAGGSTDSVQLAPSTPAPPPVPADTVATVKYDSVAVVTHTATVVTDMGEMEFELYGKDAPKTVANFVGLAKKGFYEGIGIHRVEKGFVLQMGDPQTHDSTLYEQWGTGGESIYGGTFDDELDTNLPSARLGYREGTLAMANRGPNTNTSQFFIILRDQPKQKLPYNYTIFGFVRKGMDVAHGIEAAAPKDRPLPPVRIKKITIKEIAA
jgi:cyclophilin family peptidyl-prolyl cis-trans isomerase